MNQVVTNLVRTACQQVFLFTLTQTNKSISRTLTKVTLGLKEKNFHGICSSEKIFFKDGSKILRPVWNSG
jgi:hypothetical protein